MQKAPVIIDVEASGFGKDSYPIEVGYVDKHGQPWCSLIQPCDSWTHWNASAETLHQISRDNLLAKGRSVRDVAGHLNDKLMNQTVYSDGWLHDFTWLHGLFSAAKMTPHFHLQDLRTILTPFQQSIWHAAKQQVLSELQQTRHRASADAQVLQLTWLKTAEREARMPSQKKQASQLYVMGVA